MTARGAMLSVLLGLVSMPVPAEWVYVCRMDGVARRVSCCDDHAAARPSVGAREIRSGRCCDAEHTEPTPRDLTRRLSDTADLAAIAVAPGQSPITFPDAETRRAGARSPPGVGPPARIEFCRLLI